MCVFSYLASGNKTTEEGDHSAISFSFAIVELSLALLSLLHSL